MCFSFLSLCEFSRFPVRNALTAFVFPFVLLLFARGIVREEEMTFSLFPLCFCRRCGGENFERGDDDDRHHLFVSSKTWKSTCEKKIEKTRSNQ